MGYKQIANEETLTDWAEGNLVGSVEIRTCNDYLERE
jgi:hypothetical protein